MRSGTLTGKRRGRKRSVAKINLSKKQAIVINTYDIMLHFNGDYIFEYHDNIAYYKSRLVHVLASKNTCFPETSPLCNDSFYLEFTSHPICHLHTSQLEVS